VPTIRITADTQVPAERVLEAARDFSPRRADVFPAVSVERMTVHEVEGTSADVTEGTRAGVGVNWERCRYDWSQPGVVTATVTDSNVYGSPGSSWELRASQADGGTRVEMTWVREFQRTPRGRFWGSLFRLAGKPIFGKYARDVLRNLEKVEAKG
jgi:hypothetical protein